MFEQAYGGQGVECGVLNMFGPRSVTMRRCGHVGGSMSLGVGFEVTKAHIRHKVFLPTDQDGKL